jgi:peptidyl-prolyl cis-trans isomerase A (cyclophilin A)
MKQAWMAAWVLAFASCTDGAAPPPPAAPEKPKEADAGRTSEPLLDPKHPEMNKEAPATFKAKFETSKGTFVVEVTRDWSPRGADRFYNLVRHKFFDEARFFRVVAGFMAQVGISGDPAVAAKWLDANIKDDPSKPGVSNTRGLVTFAKTGMPDSRSTQIFFNYKDNSRLDAMGFTPFGKVIEGMDVVDALYSGYGDGPPRGAGPDQGLIQRSGNAYLKREFPELDYVKTARLLE